MNTNDARAEARSRANRRLRNLTIGTAMLGVAATGGLGWAAALSYDGTTAIVTSDAATDSSTTTASPSASTSTTTTGTAPTVVSSGGGAHASTGGS